MKFMFEEPFSLIKMYIIYIKSVIQMVHFAPLSINKYLARFKTVNTRTLFSVNPYTLEQFLISGQILLLHL